MIRILIFLLSIIFFAGAITYFASLDSRITGEAFGFKFDGPSGLLLGGVFAAFLGVIYLTHTIHNLLSLPAKIKAREIEARRSRGIVALTRGLEAVAVGDAPDASHHAKVARRHLDDIALTRLLSAQAAQLSGDESAANESFSAMLDAPETEFLGLKGLFLQAQAKEDSKAAQGYAERAFRLRPNARWAFESVVELGLERGAWREARDAINIARKNNLLSQEKADRATAVLFTADAYAASLAGDHKGALSESEAALKLAPGFAPAALLAAQLIADDGKRGRAAKIIETAFTAEAHPVYVKFFDSLYSDETPEKRSASLRRLAEKNGETREAALLRARAHNLLEEWPEAIELLEPLLTASPGALEFTLMATAASGFIGPDAGRIWLERAATAPRDPRPGVDGEFHFTSDGWARLVREYMEYGRLAPPPLEDMAPGMSVEEIRLLTAPAAPDIATNEGEVAAMDELDTKPQAAVAAPLDEDDQIHNDEEAERAAAAARLVS